MGKIFTGIPPILNFGVRIRVRFKIRVRFWVRVRVKDRVVVGMVFKVRVCFYLLILWRVMGGNVSKMFS